MKKRTVDVAVIGGGPAGLAAAAAAKRWGAGKVLILERDERLGGILNQCVHEGFGLEIFKEALTGPEYAQRFIDEVQSLDIEVMLNSMVTGLDSERLLTAVNEDGVHKIGARAVVLAMGCRERTRGAVGIPGDRPAGIFKAGEAQYFINIMDRMVGRRVVILGSGDIGLIMARRLVLEGAEVPAVVEILPYCGGLLRNRVQCLEDFDIPLLLNHTVIEIKGRDRVDSVIVARVDENLNPIKRTKKVIDCDTLLLSVGLIPENELSRMAGVVIDDKTGGAVVDEHLMTSSEGIFACGNVLVVHDVVDFVTHDAERAGRNAALFSKGKLVDKKDIPVHPGPGIRLAVPQFVSPDEAEIYMRVAEPGSYKKIVIKDGRRIVKTKKLKYVSPPEMIRLRLKGQDIADARKLTVSVE